MREWSLNFWPSKGYANQLAMWVRLSGLPIEYYDHKVLTFIGNRIGKAIKVDKNTLSREWGKYVRLCIQVDLTKPLLAMFAINGWNFKVEYEMIHLLCLNCSKYGHSVKGCESHKEFLPGKDGGNKDNPYGSNINEENMYGQGITTGLRTTAQKTKKGRRNKQDSAKEDSFDKRHKKSASSNGSRF